MIVDGHEDVALNALAEGRDYLTSAAAIRAAEADTEVEHIYGRCMLGLADWLRGEVGVVVATISPGVPIEIVSDARTLEAVVQSWDAAAPAGDRSGSCS